MKSPCKSDRVLVFAVNTTDAILLSIEYTSRILHPIFHKNAIFMEYENVNYVNIYKINKLIGLLHSVIVCYGVRAKHKLIGERYSAHNLSAIR